MKGDEVEVSKSFISRNWQVIVTIALIIFNMGYTVANLESKPSRDEVKTTIQHELDKYNSDIKNNYIEIKKVPGLAERLDNIDKNLQDLKDRFDNMENKIYKVK